MRRLVGHLEFIYFYLVRNTLVSVARTELARFLKFAGRLKMSVVFIVPVLRSGRISVHCSGDRRTSDHLQSTGCRWHALPRKSTYRQPLDAIGHFYANLPWRPSFAFVSRCCSFFLHLNRATIDHDRNSLLSPTRYTMVFSMITIFDCWIGIGLRAEWWHTELHEFINYHIIIIFYLCEFRTINI